MVCEWVVDILLNKFQRTQNGVRCDSLIKTINILQTPYMSCKITIFVYQEKSESHQHQHVYPSSETVRKFVSFLSCM